MCGKLFQSRILTAWLLIAGSLGAGAATITNVTVVNVSPTSFSVLWHAGGSTPGITVFTDPAGASNVTSQLGVEFSPVHSGNPDLAAGYARRQSQIVLRQKMQSYATVLVRVTGLQPSTTYYYQLSATPVSGLTTNYPVSGPLPGVTTEQENTFVIDDQQLLVDVPGLDTMGQVVTLTHTNATHPLAAVVGDGVGTNQVYFNLNDLFALAGGAGNISPLGAQTFTVTSWTGKGPDTVAQFTVSFSASFTTGHGNQNTFGTEFLALSIGSAVLQVSQSSNVPVGFNSSVGLASVDLTLNVPPGHLSNLALTSLATEIDPVTVSVTVQSVSNVVLHLPARSGQVIVGAKQLAQFSFQATAGKPSAFVPLKITQATGTKPGSTLVNNVTSQSGRLILVGAEPLLENTRSSNGVLGLTLYATPMLSYALEYTSQLGTNAVWMRLPPLAITQLITPVSGPTGSFSQLFYRALQYNVDPPYLQARVNPDGSRYAMLFGKPGSSYVIESATAVSAHPTWSALTNVALATPFTSVPISKPGTAFLRTGRTSP